MKVRYLIKFSKEGNIKFVSHLDLMRTLHKVVKRAALPVKYSKGFNPHMSISIAQPLSVGMYSCGEYMDVVLEEEIDEVYVNDKLNENAPSGIKFLGATKIRDAKENEKKVPQSMAAIDGARYILKIKYTNTNNLNDEIKNIGKMQQWNVVKVGKKGEKEVNIKPMMKGFKYKIEENLLIIDAMVSCGSRENLSADVLAKFIKENTTCVKEDSFIDIQRQELYGLKNKEYVPLDEFLKNA